MKIDFSKEQLLSIYRSGGNEARLAIKEALGDEFASTLPVTERIKTLDDAVSELGEDNPAVKAYRSIKYGYAISETDPETADIMAYAALRVIVEALNEGWKPQFTKGEWRWYAWYDLVSPEQIEDMSEEEKCRVVGRASHNASAGGGLVYSHAGYVSTYSNTGSGSRLAFKNEELAEYAAKQFGEIFADFCFIPKAACKNDKD